jgi:adenosine deaminase
MLGVVSVSSAQTVVERRFEEVRKSPPELYAFLLRMPKGADLHNHLAGAVYAETYLEEAAKASLCVDPTTLSFVAPSVAGSGVCFEGRISASAVEKNDSVESALIDSLSMRDFVAGRVSGHDHFFHAFDKFTVASHGNDGDYVANVVRRAAQQNESYLELMALGAGSAISKLGTQAGLSADFETTRQKLMAEGIESRVDDLKARVDEIEKGRISNLHCDSEPETPPCRVVVRYIIQVLRASPKEQVFAQTLAAFMLAASDRRVVALNFVQPEHNWTALHDYHLHMQMIDFLRGHYPKVHIALHAGELTSGLVPPEDLRFHIREAVELGHAERIGHGVDIMYELDSLNTLSEMRNNHIAVEINLTSNDLILGVRGKDHPFPVYRKYGVPVTISTDDEGVSRTHLTQEYQRAVISYDLSYADLKQIVRNGLEYAFLPGASLWQDASYHVLTAQCAAGKHGKSCEAFLKANEKARLQADLEDRFDAFERSFEVARR